MSRVHLKGSSVLRECLCVFDLFTRRGMRKKSTCFRTRHSRLQDSRGSHAVLARALALSSRTMSLLRRHTVPCKWQEGKHSESSLPWRGSWRVEILGKRMSASQESLRMWVTHNTPVCERLYFVKICIWPYFFTRQTKLTFWSSLCIRQMFSKSSQNTTLHNPPQFTG